MSHKRPLDDSGFADTSAQPTPLKKNRMYTDDADGINGGSSNSMPVSLMPLHGNTTFKFPITQRRQIEVTYYDPEDTKKGPTILPYNCLQWYIEQPTSLDANVQLNGRAKQLIRRDLDDLDWYGWRPLTTTVRLSNFIPLQDELQVAGGTAIETTSFNATPYMYINTDTIGNRELTPCQNFDVKDIIKTKVQLLNARQIGGGYTIEDGPLSQEGKVEVFKAGDVWTHNHSWPKHSGWIYKRPRQDWLKDNIYWLPFRISNPGEYMYSASGYLQDATMTQFKLPQQFTAPLITFNMPYVKKADDVFVLAAISMAYSQLTHGVFFYNRAVGGIFLVVIITVLLCKFNTHACYYVLCLLVATNGVLFVMPNLAYSQLIIAVFFYNHAVGGIILSAIIIL